MLTTNGHGTATSKTIAKFVIGAAGAVVLGKVLPLAFANAVGTVRGIRGGDPFKGLIREHRELLSLLDKMERTPADNPAKRMALFLAFKRTIGKHAMAEEDIVYPLLQHDGEREQEARKLYEEHAKMKVLLFELERSADDQQQWINNVRALRNEIVPHTRREEQVEFPELKARLNRVKTAELSRKIEQEEALVV
jgi:iron-sulfur cluster repair protein YtfE (RIC family)